MKSPYWFGIYLLLGLWLLISPYALGFTDNLNAYWNAIGSGAVSVVLALVAIYYEREHLREPGFSHKSTSTA